MKAPSIFIELVVKNHLISHGFDKENKEVLEEIIVDNSTKKIISIDRIQSISEEYILTNYSNERLIYWEYEGSLDEITRKIKELQM